MSANTKEEVTLDFVATLDTCFVDSGQTKVRNDVTDDAIVDTTKEDSDPIVTNSKTDRNKMEGEAKNDINDNFVVDIDDDAPIKDEVTETLEAKSLQSETEVVSSSDDAAIPMLVLSLPIPTVRIKLGGGKEKKAVYKLIVEKSDIVKERAEPLNEKTELNREEDSVYEALPDANGSVEREDSDRERFKVLPSSSSDPHDDCFTSEEGRKSYVVHCMDVLASKRRRLTGHIKRLTPFQYFCKHVDRPLLYSIFGNTIDGYTCPLCRHCHRLLPAFLFHMRTHKDITMLLELYVNVGGRLINLDGTIKRIRNFSRRRSRVRRTAPKFTIRKRQPKIQQFAKVETECLLPAANGDIADVAANEAPVGFDEIPMLVAVPVVENKIQATTVVSLTFEEWTKSTFSYPRTPVLPHLDVNDDENVKTFVKMVCDHVAHLRSKFSIYRKNVTLFEILCKFLERPVLYDIFKSSSQGFRCPICRHFAEKLKYMMSHVRGHRDLALILELYLKRGGKFDFKVKEQPRRRKPKTVIEREEKVVPIVRRTYRKRAPRRIAAERLQKTLATKDDIKKELGDVSNLDSINVDGHLERTETASKKRGPRAELHTEDQREVMPQSGDVNSEVPTTSSKPDTSTTKMKKCEPFRFRGIGESVKTRRTDGFCAKALQPKTFNMLRGIVSRRITKKNPHFCLFCGKLFNSGSGLYIHYYLHEKDEDTESRNGVVPSIVAGPSTSVVPPSEGSSSEDGNLPLASTMKQDKEDASVVADEEQHENNLALKARRRRMYSTKSTRAKTLYMFNGILTEKITRDNPHYCKYCGHPFFSGQGVYKHYLLHTKVPTKKTVAKPRALRIPTGDIGSSSSTLFDTARNEKPNCSTSPRNKRKLSDVDNDHEMNENDLQERSETSKEIENPSKDLDPDTVNMLKEILKNKISVDNPHYCHECGYRFNSGCGLYSHYYIHFTQDKGKKKCRAQVSERVTATAATSRDHTDTTKRTSETTTDVCIGTDTVVGAATSKRRNRGNSTRPKKFVPAVYLDANTYLLLRRIAKETTPENPHLCMICDHSFHDGRGIYAHYNRHARQNTNMESSKRPKQKQLPNADFSKRVNNRPTKIVEPKQEATKKTPERNELQNKFCPMKALNKSTLNMLQGVIKRKITPENPHNCTFCSKPFFSGTGLYFHYLKHWKESDNPIVSEDPGPMTNSAATKPNVASYSGRSTATSDRSNDSEHCATKEAELEMVLRELEHNTKTLLYCLTRDALVLKDLGWPNRAAVDVVVDILTICNILPFGQCGNSNTEKLHCLRNNVHRLIRFCISEEAMSDHGWSYKLVDDAIKEIIASDENFSIF